MNKNLKRFKILALLTAIAVMTNLVGVQTVLAQTPTVSATVNAGALAFGTISSTLTFTAVTAAATASNDATSAVLAVAVNDLRGTASGWNVQSVVHNLGIGGADVVQRDSAGTGTGTVATTGTYTGLKHLTAHTRTSTVPAGELTFAVDTVVSGAATQGDITFPDGTTSLNQAITSNVITIEGLTLTFSASGHVVGDTWVFKVDSFNHTAIDSLTDTLASPSSSSTANITARTESAYVAGTGGTAVIRTSSGPGSGTDKDMSAAVSNGLGEFTYNHTLKLSVHGAARPGTYTGTLTLTLATGA